VIGCDRSHKQYIYNIGIRVDMSSDSE
jgi:hypothetical protein